MSVAASGAPLPRPSQPHLQRHPIPASMKIPDYVPLSINEPTRIGRSVEMDVRLDSKIKPFMISRTHAKIVYNPTTHSFTIYDTNSKNGVFVNDRKIDTAILHSGDIITFGGGPELRLGSVLQQPQSEFRYTFIDENEQTNSDDGDENAFEFFKTITDNINVIFTWITSLFFVSTYLTADEDSEEYSYIRTYVKPIYDTLHVPFTRVSIRAGFIAVVFAFIYAVMLIWRRNRKNKSKRN